MCLCVFVFVLVCVVPVCSNLIHGSHRCTAECGAGFYCGAGSVCYNGASDPGGCTTSPTPCTIANTVAGTYCPSGTASGVRTACPPGYFCTGANASEQLCTAGFFCPTSTVCANGATDAGACVTARKECAAGFYCPAGTVCANGATDDGTCATTPKACDAGYYCTPGSSTSQGVVNTPTSSGSPAPCPVGSFSAGGAGTPACVRCDAGFYGDATSQMASTCVGACAAGYYCLAGSSTGQGVVQTPTSSGSPTPCPVGSFSAGGAGTPACVRCDAGFYGDATSQMASTCVGACAAGYYCLAGSSTGQGVVTTPTSSGSPAPCPVGSFSAGGASTPTCTPCTAGYYGTTTAASACLDVCPIGYFTIGGGSSQAACTLCAAGRHGDATAQTASTCAGPCAAGFYCLAGSTSSHGSGVCPIGTYSVAGTGTTPDCTACTAHPGSYCPPGSVTATGIPCNGGSVCLGGTSARVACVAKQLWWGTGVEDFESSEIWESRNTVTPAQNCTTAAHGSCSAFFSESYGRDFEGSLNIRGSMTSDGYDSADFPYMCMCVLLVFAPRSSFPLIPPQASRSRTPCASPHECLAVPRAGLTRFLRARE